MQYQMKILGLALAAVTLCSAQPLPVSDRTKGIIKAMIEQKRKNKDFVPSSVIDETLFFDDFEVENYRTARSKQAEKARQTRRFDQQFGESAAGGGATSLVAKTSVSNLFSAAFENGALARDRQGSLTTFRTNAYGIAQLFGRSRTCPISDPSCDSPGEILLRGLSGSLSIDNAQPQVVTPAATTPATTPAFGLLPSGGRVAGASFRYEWQRRHVPTTKEELAKWEKAVKIEEAGELSSSLASLAKTSADQTEPALKRLKDAFDAEVALGETDLQARLENRYATALADVRQSILATASTELVSYQQALEAYDKKLATALREIVFKPVLTAEYSHQNPANQAPLSNLRLILDKPFLGALRSGELAETAQANLTLNLAVTLYERIPVGTRPGRLRDVQAGLQFDRQLGPAKWDNRPTLALSGYYQYMKENAILEFGKDPQTPIVPIPLPRPAVEVLNTKGGIGIVQAKLVIPFGKSGVSLPMSVSWSNRTELIKESAVRGQFGLSFDLDKLFQKE